MDDYTRKRCDPYIRRLQSLALIACALGGLACYQALRDKIALVAFPPTATFASFVLTLLLIALTLLSMALEARACRAEGGSAWRSAYEGASESQRELMLETQLFLSRAVLVCWPALLLVLVVCVQAGGVELMVFSGDPIDTGSAFCLVVEVLSNALFSPSCFAKARRSHRELVDAMPQAAGLPWPWLLR